MDEDGSGSIDEGEFGDLYQRIAEKLSAIDREHEKRVAVGYGIGEKRLREYRTAFERLAQHSDNGLGVSELRQVMVFLRKRISELALINLFREIDEDESGRIDFLEFLLLMQKIEENEKFLEERGITSRDDPIKKQKEAAESGVLSAD